MLRKQDNEKLFPQIVLSLFNPVLAAVRHTRRLKLASTNHFFRAAEEPCGFSRSRGHRSRVGVSRQLFFRGECARLKRPRVAV